ncbi:MAG: hypothetical protein M5U32_08895 [Myxococcota bacterium]|nr:hypothetical protein [Myxococcota bacterium]
MKSNRARYEIRSYAGAELYGRVVREAAARGMTVSECVRRELEDLYAYRDALADALRIAGDDGGPARGLLEAALKGLEARLVGNFAVQLQRLDRLISDQSRLEAMIDRFYLGVMLHLEDVPDHVRPARLKRAAERHRAWRDVVDRIGSTTAGLQSGDTPGATDGGGLAPTRTADLHPHRE